MFELSWQHNGYIALKGIQFHYGTGVAGILMGLETVLSLMADYLGCLIHNQNNHISWNHSNIIILILRMHFTWKVMLFTCISSHLLYDGIVVLTHFIMLHIYIIIYMYVSVNWVIIGSDNGLFDAKPLPKPIITSNQSHPKTDFNENNIQTTVKPLI